MTFDKMATGSKLWGANVVDYLAPARCLLKRQKSFATGVIKPEG
jgi:hypothetical protein